MGIGFGAWGYGSGTGSQGYYDVIYTALTANNTSGQCSYFCRFFYGGNTTNTSGVLFYKNDGYGNGSPVLRCTSSSTFEFGISRNSQQGRWTIPTPSLSAWHDMLITFDWSASSNPPFIYLDGVAQTVTVANAPSGSILVGTTPYVVGNSTSLTQTGTIHCFDGIITDFAVWHKALGQAEATQLTHDTPLNILPEYLMEYLPEWENYKSLRNGPPSVLGTEQWGYPSVIGGPIPFIFKASGGGTAYSASLALGIQMATVDNTGLDAVGAMFLGVQAATNDNAGLAAVGGVSLGMAAGVSEAGNMATVSALTLGLQAGLTDNAINALAGAVSLGSQMGLGASDKLGIQAATTLGLILALTPSDTAAIGAALSLGAAFGLTPSQGSTSQYQAALALGVIASTSAGDSLAAVSSLALGLGLAITTASIDQISGSMTLGVIAGAGVNAGQMFAVNIPLGLIAGLQNSGGQSYGATMALGMVLGQAIAAATGLQVVPNERILAVQAENRTLSIQIEGRTLIVSVENRTISVKFE